MKNIRELVGVKTTKGSYGVEIEVEGKNLPIDLGGIWRVEEDGSLKAAESHEYVMPKPTDLDGVKFSLDYLKAAYEMNKSIIDESIRAGVHVHLNVQEWNIKQLMTFVMIYYIVEDILMNFCGPDREGNLFCLRTKDAEFVLFKLLQTLNSRNLKHLNNDIIRYSSLNFYSLFKYGSIEFRGMRGTGDLDLIYNWVEIIDDLRISSLKFDNPNEVMNILSGGNGQDFLEMVLPNTHKLLDKSDADKTVRDSARRVQMIAFTVDWDNISKDSINPFNKETF